MATILAKRATTEVPTALGDDHHDALAADPSISQFPQGTSYGTQPSISNGASAFGSPSSGGFNAPGAFSSSTTVTNSFGSQPLGNGSNMGTVQQQPVTNLTAGAEAAVKGGAESTVELDKDATDWINKKWRPVMGWMYMMVCVCDFTLFPVLWSVLQALSHGSVTTQWQPLTLQGAGLFHVAMGAVLGIAAYGRTKEKIEGKS